MQSVDASSPCKRTTDSIVLPPGQRIPLRIYICGRNFVFTRSFSRCIERHLLDNAAERMLSSLSITDLQACEKNISGPSSSSSSIYGVRINPLEMAILTTDFPPSRTSLFTDYFYIVKSCCLVVRKGFILNYQRDEMTPLDGRRDLSVAQNGGPLAVKGRMGNANGRPCGR